MTNVIRLIALLETFRKKNHFSLEEDNWYSCPMHPGYTGETDKNRCECGFFINNQRVDEALSLVEKLIVKDSE